MVNQENKFPCEVGKSNLIDKTTSKEFDIQLLNKNQRKNQHLRYCKFLDVNNPKLSDGLSVGVDLYLPRFNYAFFEAFKKVNDNPEKSRDFRFSSSSRYEYIIENNTSANWLIYDILLERLTICHNCTIPSGIGIDIPRGYFMDLRPRSGCHKDDYTLILGTIDEDYTYGFGFQILLYDKCISFDKDIRIGQFLLIQGSLIDSMIEIDEDIWNNDKIIEHKRIMRKGGFGSTGKK